MGNSIIPGRTYRRLIVCIHAILLAGIFLFVSPSPLSAQTAPVIDFVERSDDELLFLAVKYKKFLLSEDIDVYLPPDAEPNGVLLPLGILTKLLEFVVEVVPEDGWAGGWYISEDNIIEIDIINNIYRLGEKQFPIPEGAVEAHFDDLYVRADFWETLFGFKARLDYNTLSLVFESNTLLPFETHWERLDRAKKILSKRSVTDEGPPPIGKSVV